LDQAHSAARPGTNVVDGIEIGGMTIKNLNQVVTDDLAIRKTILINNVQGGIIMLERAEKLFSRELGFEDSMENLPLLVGDLSNDI